MSSQAWRRPGNSTEAPHQYLVIDNLPAVLAGIELLHLRLTQSFPEYHQHRGFITNPDRVRHPRDKLCVERGVQYVRECLFEGGDFGGLDYLREEAPR